MRTSCVVHAANTHPGGEPVRVVVVCVADSRGRTMFEKMIHLKAHSDNLRPRMLREPRWAPSMDEES